jgi:uncharacterized protein (DUF4415 family)
MTRSEVAMASDIKMVPDDDNPEWTEEDFARAKPARDILPAAFLDTARKARGRPKGSTKQLVSLRLDKDVLEKFRATGPGWQSRINEVLRKAG